MIPAQSSKLTAIAASTERYTGSPRPAAFVTAGASARSKRRGGSAGSGWTRVINMIGAPQFGQKLNTMDRNAVPNS